MDTPLVFVHLCLRWSYRLILVESRQGVVGGYMGSTVWGIWRWAWVCGVCVGVGVR